MSSTPSVAPIERVQRNVSRLQISFARSERELRESQRLRYEIFVDEMGATLHNRIPGHDHDALDEHCRHLLVRDAGSGQLIGSTRILTDVTARAAGGFYSEGEFDIEAIRRLPGRIMEIGRTCVHRDYRSGATIATLWSGLAEFVSDEGINYLIGCASVPLADGDAQRIFSDLSQKYMTPAELRVTPKLALPRQDLLAHSDYQLPPLLKAYLRVGARIGGEPCLDPDFKCADLFILLDTVNLERRYARHFLGRPQ